MNGSDGLVGTEWATGTGAYDWLQAAMSNCQSQTDSIWPGRLIYVGRTQSVGSDVFDQFETATDPTATSRIIRQDVSGMARKLADLSLAVKLLIPGLREMSQPERQNLRHYYQKFYRKA